MTPAELLAPIVGPKNCLIEDADIAPYAVDWRGTYRGTPRAVLRPGSVEEVAASVRACAAAGLAIVPAGGRTGLCGGAVVQDNGPPAVVMSLERLNRIRDVDAKDFSLVAEAGCIIQNVQEAAAAAGRLFPLSWGAQGSAMVGGALSTNAGGIRTIRWGNARDLVLGLEVVLPDGSIWHGLRRLRKDNTGYALRHVFVGAEGTLGIITAAVLKLFARPRTNEVIFVAVRDAAAALGLFRRFRENDESAIRAFEYMSGDGVDLTVQLIPGVTLPLAERAQHYALIDLASTRPDADLRGLAEQVLAPAMESGEVLDAVLAESEAQRAALWRIREEHTEAQRKAGASVKNDVSVPVSRVPELIERASEACRRLIPGIRPMPFGHMGDGNIHVNLVQPEGADPAAFLARSHDIMDCVNEVVRELDGSFSAEHGIGQLKTDMMEEWRGGAELAVMRQIKAALDPKGLMNPGKVLP